MPRVDRDAGERLVVPARVGDRQVHAQRHAGRQRRRVAERAPDVVADDAGLRRARPARWSRRRDTGPRSRSGPCGRRRRAGGVACQTERREDRRRAAGAEELQRITPRGELDEVLVQAVAVGFVAHGENHRPHGWERPGRSVSVAPYASSRDRRAGACGGGGARLRLGVRPEGGGIYRLSFEPTAAHAGRVICERTLDRPYRSFGPARTYVFRGRVPTTLRCGLRGNGRRTGTNGSRPATTAGSSGAGPGTARGTGASASSSPTSP